MEELEAIRLSDFERLDQESAANLMQVSRQTYGILISDKFAGLRVLPRSQKNANQRSRETIYLRDRKNKPRLLSIFGGKLTAYRATAEHVVGYIESSLSSSHSHIDTKNLKLVKSS